MGADERPAHFRSPSDSPRTGSRWGHRAQVVLKGAGVGRTRISAAARRRVLGVCALGGGVVLGWMLGRSGGGAGRGGAGPDAGWGAGWTREGRGAGLVFTQDGCNPYELPGFLNVSAVPAENAWVPIHAPPNCAPVDYMSGIQDLVNGTVEHDESLEFLRGRTILLIGDSVDRDHIVDMCNFLGSWSEGIGARHPLSPPYPPAEGAPPENLGDAWVDEHGHLTWPDVWQSRPINCRIAPLDLSIVSVFHFGWHNKPEPGTWLYGNTHYYPPLLIEDRIDQVAIPVLHALANRDGRSAVPDLVSITAGFWDTLSLSFLLDAAASATNKSETADKWDHWHPLPPDLLHWNEARFRDVLRHLGAQWSYAKERPRILWRTLHQVKALRWHPQVWHRELDAIGRAVVGQLVGESEAVERGGREWRRYVEESGEEGGEWEEREWEEGARQMGMGRRLKMDEWGTLMHAQMNNLKDDIHPAALPGSWLYGNMLFEQLRLEVEARKVDAARERGTRRWW